MKLFISSQKKKPKSESTFLSAEISMSFASIQYDRVRQTLASSDDVIGFVMMKKVEWSDDGNAVYVIEM